MNFRLAAACLVLLTGASGTGCSKSGELHGALQVPTGAAPLAEIRVGELDRSANGPQGLPEEGITTIEFTGYCRLDVEEPLACSSEIKHLRSPIGKRISYKVATVTGAGATWVVSEYGDAEDWNLSKALKFNGEVLDGVHFRIRAQGDIVVVAGPEERVPRFQSHAD